MLFDLPFIIILVVSILTLRILKSLLRRKAISLPYPPGPKPRNFITGNLGDFPSPSEGKTWLKYVEMGRQYGSDLIHMEAFGHHYVVINSFKAAYELLEKRALITSDRPFTLMDKLGGWINVLAINPYTERWRDFRKLFHQNFRPNAAIKFRPVQLEKVHNLLRDLLEPYDEFMDCVITLSESIAFSTIYGYDITSNKEHLPRSARHAIGVIELGATPGMDAFNYIPLIQYLPSWFPGCGFKSLAKKCAANIEEIKEVPFKIAMGQWGSENRYSLIGELIHSKGKSPDKLDIIKSMGVTTILASSDTTSSQIGTFILAMNLNPHVQRKAQQEIDNVIGTRRLPGFEDRSSLPYVEAIYRECMRWCPVLPLGIPHCTTEPDVYNGYYIPKGTTLYANIWAMNYDETVYENPEEFIPERHIKSDGSFEGINSILTYGFGRRVCVGRYVADATIWLTIASLLAVYNISKAKGPDGKEIENNVDECYHWGGSVFPKSFPCKISPRSEAAEKLIRETSGIEYEKMTIGNLN